MNIQEYVARNSSSCTTRYLCAAAWRDRGNGIFFHGGHCRYSFSNNAHTLHTAEKNSCLVKHNCVYVCQRGLETRIVGSKPAVGHIL